MTHVDHSGRRRSLPGAVILLTGVLLLTGCGGGGGPDGPDDKDGSAQKGVASLESGAPAGTPKAGTGAGATASDPDAGRPQLRLDSTDEERNRYWHYYATCLKDHGHKMLTMRGPDSIDDTDNSPAAKAAEQACKNKLPLQPPELERETNPHFDEEYRAYVKCLNQHGLKVTALPDNSGWNYDEDNTVHSSAEVQKLDKDCTMEVFGGKKN
ncbi:hypothetical protein [Streptomyces sp. NRRL S-340]|uniref:hypothetical protein n=1 Tax=Streptomyces sp. NRRL S-340 TaxID=1463901 RepID=UPI00068AC354|nr:hypothetical protein [Streptomyces sp. NRRL S-340]